MPETVEEPHVVASNPPTPPLVSIVPETTAPTSAWAVYVGLVAFVVLLAGSYFIPYPVVQWVTAIVGLLALLAGLGWYRCRTVLGALITDRYVMSLSRLQMILWTVVVLSAYAVGVFIRLKTGRPDPLGLAIPTTLWTLIGINTTVLLGTPFLLSVRSDKPMTPEAKASAAADAAKAFNETPQAIADRSDGPVYANEAASDARLTDIFEGDEISNTHIVDLAKVQMFFFTAISAFVWIVSFVKLVHDASVHGHLDGTKIDSLPTLPDGMLALLGFSNTAYLANKGIDHTK